jgi:hypothetical protein
MDPVLLQQSLRDLQLQVHLCGKLQQQVLPTGDQQRTMVSALFMLLFWSL